MEKLSPLQLNVLQLEKLRRLNSSLHVIDKNLRKQWQQAKETIKSADNWVHDYEIEATLYFILDYQDSKFNAHGDNILATLNYICSPHSDDNWNEFKNRVDHPMQQEEHCYLYHCLYDHTDLGWENILRIGEVWVDIKIVYQNWITTIE